MNQNQNDDKLNPFQKQILRMLTGISLVNLPKEKWEKVREDYFIGINIFENAGKEFVYKYIGSQQKLVIEINIVCWEDKIEIYVIKNNNLNCIRDNAKLRQEFLDEGRKITRFLKEAFHYLLSENQDLKQRFDDGIYQLKFENQDNIFKCLL